MHTANNGTLSTPYSQDIFKNENPDFTRKFKAIKAIFSSQPINTILPYAPLPHFQPAVK